MIKYYTTQQWGHWKLGVYLSFVLFLYYCFDASTVGVSFFISEIQKSEVITETSDSKSVMEMFAVPFTCLSSRKSNVCICCQLIIHIQCRPIPLVINWRHIQCSPQMISSWSFCFQQQWQNRCLNSQSCCWVNWNTAACQCSSKQFVWIFGVQQLDCLVSR